MNNKFFNIPSDKWSERSIYLIIIIVSAVVVFFMLKSCDKKEPNLIEKQIHELLTNQERFKESILILTTENQLLQDEVQEAKKEAIKKDNILIDGTKLHKQELEKRKAELLKIKKLINQ